MTEHKTMRAVSSVGHLSDLAPWKAELLLNTRLWLSGNSGQSDVWNSYATAFGPQEGRRKLQRFERLLAIIEQNMIRPLAHRRAECAFIGSDEAAFVQLVALACDGDLNEASILAALLVRPSCAEMVAVLAGEVGATKRQICKAALIKHCDEQGQPVTVH